MKTLRPPRTWTRFLLVPAVLLLLGAAQTAAEPANAEFNEAALLAAPEPPPAPPGFKSYEAAMAAILMKLVPIIPVEQGVPVPEGVVELKDLEYGKVGARRLLLDLYMPEGLNKPAPGLVFIHGGGWEKGDKSDYKYYTVRYARRGYVVATISYRFVKEATFPACVQDAKCAVRWMRANAAKYHVDPNKIAAIGGSAGGHLAMMLGYSAGVAELEGDGGHAEYSSAVQAVVDLYGPCDLTVASDRDHPTVRQFFGGRTYEEATEAYNLASPIKHLDKSDPPTLIFHGTIDELVPVAQSDTLAKRLGELGIPCEYERIEGFPHTMDLARDINVRCQWFINRFLKKHLPFGE